MVVFSRIVILTGCMLRTIANTWSSPTWCLYNTFTSIAWIFYKAMPEKSFVKTKKMKLEVLFNFVFTYKKKENNHNQLLLCVDWFRVLDRSSIACKLIACFFANSAFMSLWESTDSTPSASVKWYKCTFNKTFQSMGIKIQSFDWLIGFTNVYFNTKWLSI